MSITKQDIITAIKNLDVFLKVPELQGAKPRINRNGSPFAYVGGFNMVFQLEHQSKNWAFRVWHVPMGENKERYLKISKYLNEKKLPYFADFIYDEKGLLVNGTLLDTIRMGWLEGKLLKEYIEENLSNKSKLTKLANDFLEMCKNMRINKISHGDLQEGNILIDKHSNIRLVDYDSVCVPEIEGQRELVTGLKGYQHPSRFKSGEMSLKTDYFSELVIYLSILAIAEKPDLWNKYQVKDTQYLLFTENDFEDFENSKIYNDLHRLSKLVKGLVKTLLGYLEVNSYLDLLPLESLMTKPTIKSFSSQLTSVLKGKRVQLLWDVESAENISISGIGNVTGKQSITVFPAKTTTYNTYKLTAENAFGKAEQEITIKVCPLPKIKEFRPKHGKLEYGKETSLVWNVKHAEKVELQYNGISETIEFKGERIITPTTHTNYKLVIIALDGTTKQEKEITVEVFKKVLLNDFNIDLDYVIESLPVKLTWEVQNANKVLVEDNLGTQIDVTGEKGLKVITKRNTKYFKLIVFDPLHNIVEKKVDIVVDERPKLPLLPDLPKGKDLLPTFELSFKELVEDALSQTQMDFQKAMQPRKGFSLLNSLKSLLKN